MNEVHAFGRSGQFSFSQYDTKARCCIRSIFPVRSEICFLWRLWSLISWTHRHAVAPTPWGTGSTCPHFYKWLGTGGTVSRRTANKKLTKRYRPSWKRSPKRLIVLLEPKSGGARPKKIFPALRAGSVPPRHWRHVKLRIRIYMLSRCLSSRCIITEP